jgi:ubiquinone/menaquinone biosynthesis C-methylase UbiE
MSFYAEHVFPYLMDWVMSGEIFAEERRKLLADVRGRVLELGFGTGLNLAHYPDTISVLHAVDPATMLARRAAERSAQASFPVRFEPVSAETLPHAEGTFDYVVSTWTLCTIPDPIKALKETRRVLKPDGAFLFLEHGRSDDVRVATWQDRLNPIQRVIGCGCNLNRRVDRLIAEAGLRIEKLDRFLMPHVPRLGGEMYRGRAKPS